MFFIEIIRPALLGKKDSEDTTIPEAIETIYSEAGRMINIHWNHFIIPLFGFSIGDIYYNIVRILNAIKIEKNKFTENFLDSNFTAKWFCEIINGNMKITANWIAIANLEEENITIDKLREVPNVAVVNLLELRKNLEKFLRIIKEDLISAEYDSTLEGFEYLEDL